MQEWFDYIRHCPRCGKGWGKFHWLCPDCEVWLYRRLKIKARVISSAITHFYLFDWHADDTLKPVVHSLKGGGHPRAVKELVYFCCPSSGGAPIYYPQGQKKDHAWNIAKAFSEIDGGEPVGLEILSQRKQSLLARRARQARRFRPLKKRSRTAFFVDDIVTTGATFQAAYRALGQPGKMTVWSLFYRNPL